MVGEGKGSQKQEISYLLGEVAIRLNGHLSNQLWLPSHHYGRVPLVVHLHINIILNNSCFGRFFGNSPIAMKSFASLSQAGILSSLCSLPGFSKSNV